MKPYLLPAIALFVAAATADASTITDEAQRYVVNRKAAGVSIATVRCGRTQFTTAGRSGHAEDAVTADTVFEIGSLSKLLTGLLLAKAIQDRKAALNDDVRRFLPPGYDNLVWSDGAPVRLGQLVATTSGLPDYLPDPAPLARVPAVEQLPTAARMLASYSDDDFLRDLRSVKLVARPGSVANHSNVAAQLLAVILSRIYGQPFPILLRAMVEQPSDMSSGTVSPGGREAAVGRDGDGRTAPFFTGQSVTPAGGLRYSARDMAKFVRLQLSSDTAVRFSHRKLADGPDGALAFTWVLSAPRSGVTRYRLSGSTFGFSSYIELYPQLGYGIILMANQGAGDVQSDLKAIAERVFDGRSARIC